MFDPTRIPPLFQYRRTTITLVSLDQKQLFQANPYRVAFTCYSATGTIFISPLQTQVSTVAYGIQLSQNSAGVTVTLSSHGPIVQQQWFYMVPNGISGEITCWETLWQPQTG